MHPDSTWWFGLVCPQTTSESSVYVQTRTTMSTCRVILWIVSVWPARRSNGKSDGMTGKLTAATDPKLHCCLVGPRTVITYYRSDSSSDKRDGVVARVELAINTAPQPINWFLHETAPIPATQTLSRSVSLQFSVWFYISCVFIFLNFTFVFYFIVLCICVIHTVQC